MGNITKLKKQVEGQRSDLITANAPEAQKLYTEFVELEEEFQRRRSAVQDLALEAYEESIKKELFREETIDLAPRDESDPAWDLWNELDKKYEKHASKRIKQSDKCVVEN